MNQKFKVDKQTAELRDALVKFLENVEFDNQDFENPMVALEKRKKELNDFERKVAKEEGIAQKELLQDNLRFGEVAKAKLLGAVKEGVRDPNLALARKIAENRVRSQNVR